MNHQEDDRQQQNQSSACEDDRSPRAGGVSRREMFRVGGIGGAAALLGVGCGERRHPARQGASSGKKADGPKNVIFMVSDGMSMGVPSMAEAFAQFSRARGTSLQRLMKREDAVRGFLETRSLVSLVTDSAAASSAWGSGSRIENGKLNVLPDGQELVPLAKLLKEQDKRVGLVTTDHICGGTPAGFAAVTPDRNRYSEVAEQYLDRVDVLLGGGRVQFDPILRKDGMDLLGNYSRAGYDFVDQRSLLLSNDGSEKLLGLFADNQLPYTIDHRYDEQLRRTVPTLRDMTRKALLSLEGKQGFFLMVEGARIDHAAHANDPAAIIWDQLAFDDAVEEAMIWLEDRDDTLLVVTSDHGNSNPGLNGMGTRYHGSTDCFKRLMGFRGSFGRIATQTKKRAASASPADAAKQVIHEMTNLRLSGEEAAVVGEALVKSELPEEMHDQQRNPYGVLAQVLGNHVGVGWTGNSHTSDLMMLAAMGPGAECFSTVMPHKQVFAEFTRFYGIDFVNPSAEQTEA